MANWPLFRVDQPANLSEIGLGWSCANARFVFDEPLAMGANDLLELIDGQWYLVRYHKGIRERSHIEGKWSL